MTREEHRRWLIKMLTDRSEARDYYYLNDEDKKVIVEALQEPEIVHCKDCKYWIRTRIGEEELNQCGLAGYLIGGRGYCLYGKAGEE